MKAIAIDFGTSNCAAAFVHGGEPTLVELELDSLLLPSVLWVPRAPVRDVVVAESEVERVIALLRQAQVGQARSVDPELVRLNDASLRKHAWNTVLR